MSRWFRFEAQDSCRLRFSLTFMALLSCPFPIGETIEEFISAMYFDLSNRNLTALMYAGGVLHMPP